MSILTGDGPDVLRKPTRFECGKEAYDWGGEFS